MSDQPIIIVSSTNRKNAISLKIAKTYASMLEAKNLSNELVSLEDMPSDFISSALYENTGKNMLFNGIRTKMKNAQKMVFVVPEYNGSFPGVLKTFIDGLEFPGTFVNKKIAMVGVSSGIQGGVLAMSHLTDIFNYCGANVLANKPKLFGIDNKMDNDELKDSNYLELLTLQLNAFLSF